MMIPPRWFFRILSIAVCLASYVSPAEVAAGLDSFNRSIESPADGGSGPVIWYRTARTPNYGSGGSGMVLTSQGAMTEQRSDFFGNSHGAFALAAGQTAGAAIAESSATGYLTGSEASLVMTFKTPAQITANASLIGRRPAASIAGQPKFELYLLTDKQLRLTTGSTQFGDFKFMGTLVEDTWYYFAVTWDLERPANQVSWYLGKMGSTILSSGKTSASVVGSPNDAIRVAGRPTSDLFFGSYQNIAIYDRELEEIAVMTQFLSIPKFRITHFDFRPGDSPNTTIRWTDLATDYAIVATNTLPFGTEHDHVIPVDSNHGEVNTTGHPNEVEFSFLDTGATGASRFWRVQVDLMKSSIQNIVLRGQIVLAEGMEGAAVDGFIEAAEYEVSNGSDEVLYQWYRSESAEGGFQPIGGATEKTYIVTEADAWKYLRVGMSAVRNGMADRPAYSDPLQVRWRLSFADEFDYTAANGFDPVFRQKWHSEAGQRVLEPHKMARIPENIEVRDGRLIIHNRKETHPNYSFEHDWTTGSIFTVRTFSNGYFEASYKYAPATGLNQSFWAMSRTGFEYPKFIELDFNEGHYPRTVNTNLHYFDSDGQRRTNSIPYHPFGQGSQAPTLADDFNKIGGLWRSNNPAFAWDAPQNSDTFQVFINDQKYRSTRSLPYRPDNVNIFISVAIFDWAGPVTDAIDGTQLEVDYVRYYQPLPPQ